MRAGGKIVWGNLHTMGYSVWVQRRWRQRQKKELIQITEFSGLEAPILKQTGLLFG